MDKAFKMETTLNENAFPSNGWGDGMTLRDYFAAKAMNAILKDWNCFELASRKAPIGIIIEAAYNIADAMIKQREL
jgi:hypothetical protein